VRKSSLVSNTFFNAAEFAGLIQDGVVLPDVLRCVFTSPERRGGESTFHAVRGGITNDAFPEPMECTDSKTKKKVANLRDVQGEVLIVGHGNAMYPRLELAFGPKGNLERESFTADEIADLLVQNGLACDHKLVTVLVVQGGQRITTAGANRRFIELFRKMRFAQNEEQANTFRAEWGALAMRMRDPNTFENNANIPKREIPFIAMLANSLRERGFLNITVQGFRGEVLSRLGRNPTNPGPYSGLKMFITASNLAQGLCRSQTTGKDRRKCVDDLMAPCDSCLLSSAKNGKSFVERLSDCRTQLAAGPNKDSAQVCGIEAQYANSQWMFSVNSESLGAKEEGDDE